MDSGIIYSLLQKVQNLDEFMMYNNAQFKLRKKTS